MNTCSSCGRQFQSGLPACPVCGASSGVEPVSSLEARPSIRSALVRTCSTEIETDLVVRALESAGIVSLVIVDDCGGMLQPISAAKGFRVMVGEPDLARAREILEESGRNPA